MTAPAAPRPVPLQIVEVGPRDGLQNEARTLPPPVRAELIRRLLAAGVTQLEAVSFVHPQRVPQMAGAEEVLSVVQPQAPPASLLGLVLNERGFERALTAGIQHVRYSFSVTEVFARRNQNAGVEESVALALHLVSRARAAGLRIGLVLSTSFGSPFEGRVAPAHVLSIAERVAAAAPDELIFADTIGAGAPSAVREVVSGAVAWEVPGMRVGGHFHNTRNTGYANAVAALEAGASVLDSSIGGIGGCPFAPRATGNIATEDLGYLLREMGIQTGLELDGLLDISRWLGEQLGHDVPGLLVKAGDIGAGNAVSDDA
ncbi:hydroxymethylglutaryl-CoA lyase [Deinococcus sp. KNUC1210]|uniref:hydroxymethylglutaryl-CoA lyase n=1 Tax=Deinococcus sp. KNUC1210 TaxID=2917691 RepID=UPI001EF01258|nr:hydroxymethylglutaryl-CoA lyase [Deinococcus sp. KNUC1210]ULH16106.1 hydroxymethylglutaryl-CoA lyase [Deinococcus sp. KNUC1210]